MVVDITFLALSIVGPLAVAALGALGGGPRLAILGGLTTALYVGVASNEPFYTNLVYVLGALAAIIAGLRFARLVVE